MFPSDQRFKVPNLACFERNYRLIMNSEFVSFKRAAQIGFDVQQIYVLNIHFAVKNLITRLAGFLHPISDTMARLVKSIYRASNSAEIGVDFADNPEYSTDIRLFIAQAKIFSNEGGFYELFEKIRLNICGCRVLFKPLCGRQLCTAGKSQMERQ